MLRRPPELKVLNAGDLGVKIRLSARLLDTRACSAIGEACVERFAICGKEEAAVDCVGEDGRPEVAGGSICERAWSSLYDGLRIFCMPSGLDGDESVNRGGSRLVEVTAPSGGSVVLGGPA